MVWATSLSKIFVLKTFGGVNRPLNEESELNKTFAKGMGIQLGGMAILAILLAVTNPSITLTLTITTIIAIATYGSIAMSRDFKYPDPKVILGLVSHERYSLFLCYSDVPTTWQMITPFWDGRVKWNIGQPGDDIPVLYLSALSRAILDVQDINADVGLTKFSDKHWHVVIPRSVKFADLLHERMVAHAASLTQKPLEIEVRHEKVKVGSFYP